MKNQIYYGDNIEVLRHYIQNESIDLCYIDPPFNSKRNYNQIYNNIGQEDKAQAQAFIDTWTWDDYANKALFEIQSNYNNIFTEQSIDLISGLEKVLKKGSLLAYLVSMTLRIGEIHRVLKATGSFYLHCDPNASHYLKLVCDTIFCSRGGEYVNEISWRRTNAKSDYKQGAKNWGRVRDVILLYSKSDNLKGTFNQQFAAYTDEYVKKFYKYQDDDGRRYMLDNLAAPGAGSRGHPSYEFLGVTRFWRYNKAKMEQLFQEGRIVQSKEGNVPRYKRYLDEMSGVSICDDWNDILPIQAQSKERLGYPTQKPEALLERIIKASSNEGNVILDAYCGCGTTVAVAEQLKRRWIGIDITYQSISLILKRLEEKFGQDFTQDVVDKNTKQIKQLSTLEIKGTPKDFESAVALANKQDDRTRKEFEKWMVLTYSKNKAIINEKKGGDGGIDGICYVPDRNKNGKIENKKALFSVKSNKTLTPAVIRELNGTIEREKAICGILLTLYPMPNLVKESKQYGTYHNLLINREYPKIQVISVEEMFNGKYLELPNVINVLKDAEQYVDQIGLDY